LVAVALSKCNVGVDLELVDNRQNFNLLKKSMLNQNETTQINNLLDSYSVWTKKEAIYKYHY
jgi:phosphopantetheinyl transferase